MESQQGNVPPANPPTISGKLIIVKGTVPDNSEEPATNNQPNAFIDIENIQISSVNLELSDWMPADAFDPSIGNMTISFSRMESPGGPVYAGLIPNKKLELFPIGNDYSVNLQFNINIETYTFAGVGVSITFK